MKPPAKFLRNERAWRAMWVTRSEVMNWWRVWAADARDWVRRVQMGVMRLCQIHGFGE